jgi:Na+-driven multidrug efflux pump
VSAYAAGYMAVAAALLTLFAPALISLFDPTPQVVAIGATCLRLVVWSEVASAIGVVLARSLDGAGDTLPAMVVNLISLWVVDVVVAFLLARGLGLGIIGIWWGRALANLANGLLLGWWFHRGRWKQKAV